ncbi:MAG: HD domain-containing phosphohydrolase [Dermatophilaceae bacterium]
MGELERGSQARTRPRVLVYITGVWAAAIGLSVVGWLAVGPPQDIGALIVLCVVAAVSQAFTERDVGGRVSFSFASIVTLASVVLVGPVGCAIVGATAAIVDFDPLPLRARVFNSGMGALWAMLGGFAYAALGTYDIEQLEGAGELILHVGLPLMVADVVQCVANALLLAGVVALDTGASFRRFVVDMLTTSGVAYMGYGVIGFLFVILWVPAGLGPFSAILIIPPLYVAKWAFAQYGDEERAHQRTLEALVAAVEMRDPYAVGHGERIARLSEWIGEVLSVGTSQAKALRFAAILHDIGRIAAPPQRRSGQAGAGSNALASIARHPEQGAELIEEIAFLRDSVEAVRHHHERYDGRGYPDGLSGTTIPVFARIIAVADAFDSLTSDRPGRAALTVEQACAQLGERAGTQLDPMVVSALERALERHTWTPHKAAFESVPGPVLKRAFDHDDPASSDRMAELRSPAALVPERTP